MIPDKLYINLKILSKIQKNGRITRSYDGIIALESEVFFKSFKRFVSSDSRKQSVFEINSIITECTEYLNNLIQNKYMDKNHCNSDEYYKNCEDLTLILNELEQSKTGIENLKFTYSTDLNIGSQLDIILLKINSTLKDIRYKLTYFKQFLPKSAPEFNKNIDVYFENANDQIKKMELESLSELTVATGSPLKNQFLNQFQNQFQNQLQNQFQNQFQTNKNEIIQTQEPEYYLEEKTSEYIEENMIENKNIAYQTSQNYNNNFDNNNFIIDMEHLPKNT